MFHIIMAVDERSTRANSSQTKLDCRADFHPPSRVSGHDPICNAPAGIFFTQQAVDVNR
jgi:hypothetical protein